MHRKNVNMDILGICSHILANDFLIPIKSTIWVPDINPSGGETEIFQKS